MDSAKEMQCLCVLISFLLGTQSAATQTNIQQVEGIVGGKATFEARVLAGLFKHTESRSTIARVSSGGSLTVYPERFRGRVRWDSETGFFYITELNTQDTGYYTVHNTTGSGSITTFHLAVYTTQSAATQTNIQQVEGIVGGKATFEARVLAGLFKHTESRSTIARVSSGGSLTVYPERFRGRVRWDSETGFFYITELNTQDTGYYTVHNTTGSGSITTFHLAVYTTQSSATQSDIQQVEGIVGGEATFEARVLAGLFKHTESRSTIARVSSGGSLTVYPERFRGRVRWDSETGFFYITELNTQDTGYYTVHNTTGSGSITTFHLAVYTTQSSASQTDIQEVKGIVGGTATFETRVSIGLIKHTESRSTIARVSSGGSVTVYSERFRGRVRWDSETGLFYITELQTQDSGEYTVLNVAGYSLTTFHLSVYAQHEVQQVKDIVRRVGPVEARVSQGFVKYKSEGLITAGCSATPVHWRALYVFSVISVLAVLPVV
ncbi:uncharacterized protein LOC136759491 [Amia ocellicauda]|uniref:uncharacterized protein LOC136759491 n=1 Tax=Amia ocellicauda TaxID=2972642 RepID=UPI0034645E1D